MEEFQKKAAFFGVKLPKGVELARGGFVTNRTTTSSLIYRIFELKLVIFQESWFSQ